MFLGNTHSWEGDIAQSRVLLVIQFLSWFWNWLLILTTLKLMNKFDCDFFLVYLFILREREWEHGGGAEREGERENPKQVHLGTYYALHCQRRAGCGAQTHELRDHDLSQSWTQPTEPPRPPNCDSISEFHSWQLWKASSLEDSSHETPYSSSCSDYPQRSGGWVCEFSKPLQVNNPCCQLHVIALLEVNGSVFYPGMLPSYC